MGETLVLCGGAKRPNGTAILRLDLNGAPQNITLRLEDIGRRLVTNVPDLLVDLVEIATYVFCADQAISRGGAAQAGMGADWRRDFRFVIPVRSPDHWNSPKVLELLCSALSFLSDDEYAFEFENAINPPPLQSYLDLSGDEASAFTPDEVVLFSGGLDSLSGVIEELSSSAKRIALVSHRSSPKILGHQRQLVAELGMQFPKRLMHVPVLATRQGSLPVREHTQRSRSFLYAALACAVARLSGCSRTRFFENGVVSINLPISAQVIGARATRTTHPWALDRFRRLFGAIVGDAVEVDNPFIWKSKADVIQSIVRRGCGPLIKQTVSCTRTYDMTKLHTHCGCCSQCLDRRFAVLAAGAAEYDPEEMYRVDLLTGNRDRPNDQTMAESFVRTALELRDISEFAFFGRFAGETVRVCSGFPEVKPDAVAPLVLLLHQRHGQAIWDVLNAAIVKHSADFVDRSLPSSSLLMMAIAPGATPALWSPKRHTDPLESLTDDQSETVSRPTRTKGRPSHERAVRAIGELYPEGVPDAASEPNKNLCRRVGDKLKNDGLPAVSNDTILRAAGRRK